MTQRTRPYRKGSRADRFLEIRDAVLANMPGAKSVASGRMVLAVGPFLIHYCIPGAMPGRPFNMQIWPGGRQQGGHVLQADKVANVDWDQHGNVEIISFRSGTWEQELITLANSTNVEFLPRR